MENLAFVLKKLARSLINSTISDGCLLTSNFPASSFATSSKSLTSSSILEESWKTKFKYSRSALAFFFLISNSLIFLILSRGERNSWTIIEVKSSRIFSTCFFKVISWKTTTAPIISSFEMPKLLLTGDTKIWKNRSSIKTSSTVKNLSSLTLSSSFSLMSNLPPSFSMKSKMETSSLEERPTAVLAAGLTTTIL